MEGTEERLSGLLTSQKMLLLLPSLLLLLPLPPFAVTLGSLFPASPACRKEITTVLCRRRSGVALLFAGGVKRKDVVQQRGHGGGHALRHQSRWCLRALLRFRRLTFRDYCEC